jgi:hypothetical protein
MFKLIERGWQKMKFESEELDKQTLDRLSDYGIFLSRNAPPVNKEKALVLIGEAMLDKFVKEFVSLWKHEIFQNCLLRNYEASEQEVYETIHPQKPWDESTAQQDKEVGPAASYSNTCKEVNRKMNQNIQAKLENYFELFQEIKQKTGDDGIALRLLQEVSKDRRMEEIREEREMKNSEPATTRQLKFMKKLGIEVPAGVTKKEASMLIDEELGRNSE